MLRQLQIEIDEILNNKVAWYRYALPWLDEKWGRFLVKIRYYDVRAFVRNFPHFLKQAWYYRDFDNSYTIECFIQNLERLSIGLVRWNNTILSKRNSRRCKFAAHLLRDAYDDNFIFTDKSYKTWSNNNKMYFEEIQEGGYKGMYQMKHKRKYAEEYSKKMWKIINKRHMDISKAKKKEAWAYLHKYIDMFWD